MSDVDIPQIPSGGITLEYDCFLFTYLVRYKSTCCLALSFLDAYTLATAIAEKSPYLQ